MRIPFPCGYLGSSPAMVYQSIRLLADTLHADYIQVGLLARSSPPSRYGLRPILWMNLLYTNRIVNRMKEDRFDFDVLSTSVDIRVIYFKKRNKKTKIIDSIIDFIKSNILYI